MLFMLLVGESCKFTILDLGTDDFVVFIIASAPFSTWAHGSSVVSISISIIPWFWFGSKLRVHCFLRGHKIV